ncbi:hypothetical protein PV646_09145 [Streptomyces sp. ID05-26A]|nr:hypothetical protein [Streptomyces sp. ID05-26A]
MRKIIAVLAACLVLTGCGRWEDEIRFEVTRINTCYDGYSDVICATRMYVKPVGELPSGAPEPEAFKDAFVELGDFASGVTANTGDEIICAAREVSDGFEYLNGLPLTLQECRKA